ncbi:hypothetical protein GGR50DRAFT_221506 [Xylaria sp. CBS 124048]|nr:hypothetical protein GGR50DRAFT_221506 [Xylaria sp. CBS 124048]
MPENHRVKFSIPLNRDDSPPRDSGVGSSSSDRTVSSGSPDESFTAHDYDIQSNSVDALREALRDAIKDIEKLKDKYRKEQMDHSQTYKALREANRKYREQCEYTKEVEGRMKKQDTALDTANARIQTLQEQLDAYKEKYKDLHERYQEKVNSTDGSIISGGSGDHSHGSRSYLESDHSDIHRLKERINRDTDSSSANVSKSSRSSDNTTSSKRTSSTAISQPYIEKMPPRKPHKANLVSPREHGTFNLTTAANISSAKRHGTTASSRRHEGGDYIPYPLPDRS